MTPSVAQDEKVLRLRGVDALRFVGTHEQLALAATQLFKAVPREARSSFVRDPEVRAWLQSLEADWLTKALTPGGPSMRGLSPDDLAVDVAESKVRADEILTVLRERMQDHISDFKAASALRPKLGTGATGLLTRSQAEYRIKRDIREAYRDVFEAGKRTGGNFLYATGGEQKLLERMRRDEFLYLRNFLDDIEQGKGTMPYPVRATLYGNAANEARWAGFVYSDLSPSRYLAWRLSTEPSETCGDCELLSGRLSRWANGVYSAQEIANMAIFPGSGKLECTTRCNCHLEDVLRPTGPPAGKFITGKFETLAPKSPIRHRYGKHKPRYALRREKRR